MERQLYCVYNQTSECFLSLGATLGDNTFARLKSVLGKGSLAMDEGAWITARSGFQPMGIFATRDLVYLDEGHKVVAVVESCRLFRKPPMHSDAESFLVLPVRTIASSQTRPGNQLMICAADEMEFRLRSLPNRTSEESAPPLSAEPASVSRGWLPKGLSKDRRRAKRERWPRLIAYDCDGGELDIHGIRDISATGLYLLTNERWPLGAEVKMTLQPTEGMDEAARNAITLPMRVTRWGQDGVGLEFVQTDSEQTALVAMQVR